MFLSPFSFGLANRPAPRHHQPHLHHAIASSQPAALRTCPLNTAQTGKIRADSPTTEREPSPSFSSSLIIYAHPGLLLLVFAPWSQLAQSTQTPSSHCHIMRLQQQATPESMATLPLHNLNPPHPNHRPFRSRCRILGKDRPWVSWRDSARAILFFSFHVSC